MKAEVLGAETSGRFSPAFSVATGETAVTDLHSRLGLVRHHGDFTLAYSTAIQRGLEYFGDGTGYIAYRRLWGMTFALADPVAPDASRRNLLARFLEQHPHACFWQISERTAKLLAEFDFWINDMGVDTRIDLQRYTFDGPEKRNLRMAYNRMVRRGCMIRELPPGQIDERELETLSREWRRSRTVRRRELTFLNRPIEFVCESEVRRFYLLDPDGRVVAFLFCDPVFRGGRIIGYSTAFNRKSASADAKSGQALTRHAIEQFQTEGLESIYLGLSPLAGLDDRKFRHNRPSRYCFDLFYNSKMLNRLLYPLQGHADYKRGYRGETVKTYFATNKRFNLHRYVALMHLSGIL